MRLAFTANRIFFKKNEKHVQFFFVFVYIGVRRGDPPPATKNVL